MTGKQAKVAIVLLLMLPLGALAQDGMGGGGFGRGKHGGYLRPYYSSGSIEGRVVDSAGNPLKGVSIILQQRDNDPNPDGQRDMTPVAPYYKEITTKKNGKFSFTTLRTFHTFVLVISAEGYRRWERNISFSGKISGQLPGVSKDSATTPSVLESGSSPAKELGDIQLQSLPR
ncbi:Carboxypeptidase regulatory-like domain-containing protein [Filimonas lacunae]|uniref:Carboxypeptidase regulatory-like domain-containing protein n=2 Tax=Filimonas lacunae TaxID=477680 RepID=A0A173MI72_9BACT|nr:hypothetical protein FLA_3190 [Filimonas lacunae]SIS93955.1 Carboxypeptidase regulatory-like domain-containing protein [Filimonas lacunae]